MKRRKGKGEIINLIRKLEELGCVLVRHGGRHDWYTNQTTGQSQPVPRHHEVHDHLANTIIKKLSSV
ncbi:MAG: type II toxin-antitoxin system HicA family toxin [Gammaproteobacteria bacterium]